MGEMYLLQLVIGEADKHHIVRPAAVHQGGNTGNFTSLTVELLPVCFLLQCIVAVAECCEGRCPYTSGFVDHWLIYINLENSHEMVTSDNEVYHSMIV